MSIRSQRSPGAASLARSGRGSAWSALLGIVIITSLGSGFTLLALDSSTRLLITGAVLLAAVIVDSLARARRR